MDYNGTTYRIRAHREIIAILQREALRLRETELLAQGHTAWQQMKEGGLTPASVGPQGLCSPTALSNIVATDHMC